MSFYSCLVVHIAKNFFAAKMHFSAQLLGSASAAKQILKLHFSRDCQGKIDASTRFLERGIHLASHRILSLRLFEILEGFNLNRM